MIINLAVLSYIIVSVNSDYVYSEDGTCQINGTKYKCVDVKDCPTALRNIAGKIENRICSFNGTDTTVCCSDSPTNLVYIRLREQTDTQKENKTCPWWRIKNTGVKAIDKCSEYHHKLLYPCKKNAQGQFEIPSFCKPPIEPPLIIGGVGKNAERGQFRHMALLLYGTEKSLDVFCGGSVVSERFILTAGHCLESAAGPVSQAVTGILKKSDDKRLWRLNDIKRTIPHPEYDPPNKYHDIGLLETVLEITLDDKVVPICIHTGEPLQDYKLSATGWGALGHDKPYPDILQEIPLFKKNNCGSVYGPHRHLAQGFDNNTQLCYGGDYEIRDTCQGDSGGPLQLETQACLHVAVGVTSFGKGACGVRAVPAVYTRVAAHARWVQDTVWPD